MLALKVEYEWRLSRTEGHIVMADLHTARSSVFAAAQLNQW